MEYLIGVSIWFALIWTSGAILGYVYANEHNGPKKQKRDARGRFVAAQQKADSGYEGPTKPLDLDLSGFFPKSSGQPSGISHISGFAEANNVKDCTHHDISIWGSKRASYPGRKK